MFTASLIALASLFVGQVAAHGGVTSYVIDGQNFVGWSPYNSANGQKSIGRPYSSYDPIMSTSAGSFSCNNNGQAGPGQLSATVRGGSTVTAKWKGSGHVYMAKCPGSCTSANSNNLQWFKIHETGLISGSLAKGQWGNGLIMKNLAYTVTIPSQLAAGEYLIRHELLALHQANSPQFYPECAQLIVSGGGGVNPPSRFLTRFPGGYSMSGPGVRVDIYSAQAPSITTYKVPGPAVWKGESS